MEGLTVEELLGEKQAPVLLPCVIGPDKIGVLKLPRCLHLPQETLLSSWVLPANTANYLYRDWSLEMGMPPLVDFPHPALIN